LAGPTLSRRDFVNGFLVAASPLARGVSPAAGETLATCDGSIGHDPRALRGGNLPATFDVAHWLRDGRLGFDRDAVTLSPGCDGLGGRFPITDDAETYDVVIVGAGLSGLGAAFFLLEDRPGTRILLLEANPRAGGNAARDEVPPLSFGASTAGSYCLAPYSDFQKSFYRALGIEWERHRIEAPVYSYFFDAHTPGTRPGAQGWNIDTYGKGLEQVPYPADVVADLLRCREEFRRWSQTDGAPTDPPEASGPRYDHLSGISFETYLTETLRCDPLVADFYTRYTVDALGGTAAQVNAHSAISFLSGEYGELFTFPGGTSELALRLVRRLAEATEVGRGGAALRLGAIALRADTDDREASVTYVADRVLRRARGRAVILACPSMSAKHLVAHLSDGARRDAFAAMSTVPVVVANVGLRRAAPLVELGLGYNQYYWGSRFFADFLVADWVSPRRADPERATVLTMLGANAAPPEDLPAERRRLLETPFAAYETSVREDLARLLGGTSFDALRDITSISLYRWGHAMLQPTVASVFGGRGRHVATRAEALRRVAFAPLGAISFAGQDSEGTPSVESATASGRRAASEVLARL
jgi:spermidine dehydrogenase